MDTLSYKTVSANQATVVKQWYVIDANTEIVGRLATEAARILRGKHKPSYTPHVDCGDNVIIINAEKVRFTGNKMNTKEYAFYSGHPGGRRIELAKAIIRRRPTYIVEKAIKGMLPKNKLGAHIFTNLYVYQGADHPHTAQQPVTIEIKK